MLARLIDAEKLNAVLQNQAEHLTENGDAVLAACLIVCQETVERQPTIEATPVVHGRWEKNEPDKHGNRKPKCSECGEYPLAWWSEYTRCSYCPNCGAKMDGGVSDG